MSTSKLIISFILLSYLCGSNLYGQVQTIWIGGSPGHETDWNYFKNWSKYKVPDEFNDVIISDTRSTTSVYPEIRKGNFIINSLEMHPGTTLIISKKANLIIMNDSDLMAGDKLNYPLIKTKIINDSISEYSCSGEVIKIFAKREDLLSKN